MKKVIIIGGTSGIGAALADLFVKEGFLVGITGRRNEALNERKKRNPDQIYIECFDVTSTDNIYHVESLIKQMGGLDILVYSSGFGEPSEHLDWKIDQQTILTNVNGFVEIVNFTFNYFLKTGKGQIAAISSISANRGSSFAPAYSASKAFMSNYMEGLRIKCKKLKLKVVVTDIQPGFVNSKMAKGNGQFWVAPVDKASKQIFKGILAGKNRIYVTRRWWLIAKLMKHLPFSIYQKVG